MKKITLILSLLLINCLRAEELPPGDHPFGVIATDQRLDPLCKDLQLPPISATGLV